MFINQLLSAVIQVILFSVIPLVWWLVTARKKTGYFKWVGLKLPEGKSKKDITLSTLITFAGCFAAGLAAIRIRGDAAAAESVYKGMGISAIPCVLVYSYIQTALSEEILFRGFLLKRLTARLGFKTANIIQALIFGAIHLVMVWGKVTVTAGIVIFIYPMIPAAALAYLNEKKAGGSILTSWIVHGTLNTCSILMII